MKKRLLLVVALVTLPMAAWGQGTTIPTNCPDCVLSLWDDQGLTTNYGTVTPNVMKDIYLGFKYGTGNAGFTVMEFSIHGMRTAEDGVIITNTTWLTSVPPNVTLGTINAPADTSASSIGTGGMNVAWPTCQEQPLGDTQIAVAKLTFLVFTPITNKVFTVTRRFPPSNTNYNNRAIFTQCNAEFAPVWPVTGCYVANWDGTTVLSCGQKTPVSETNWTAVKQMFK